MSATRIRPAETTPQEPIPQVAVGGAPGSGAGKDGWLPLGFDPSVVQTLSTLYGKWTSGLREMYANMVTACKKASAEFPGVDPHIRVLLVGRRLIMEDRDSIGMSREVFLEGIAVAGHTGNDNPYSPGRWGLGSLAWIMLADEMLLESHSRETGERFAVQALKGGRFRTGGLPEPDIDWFGTRASLVLRDGLDMEDAAAAIGGMALMSGVRTILEARRDGGRSGDGGCHASDLIDTVAGLDGRVLEGRDKNGAAVELRRTTVVEHACRGLTEYSVPAETSTLADGSCFAVFHGRTPDMEAAGVMYCGESCIPIGMGFGRKTWLAGMPIDSEPAGDFGRMRSCAIHFKNERLYKTTPDRERFTLESRARMGRDANAILDKVVLERRFGTLGEYLSDHSNRVIDAAIELPRYGGDGGKDSEKAARRALESIPARMRSIVRAGSAHIRVYGDDGPRTLWTAVHCGKKAARPHYSSMGEMMHAGHVPAFAGRAPEPLLVVAARLDTRKAEAVMRHAAKNHPGRAAVVFRPDAGSAVGIDAYESLGAVRMDKYMAENGIRPLFAEEARKLCGRAGPPVLTAYGGDTLSGGYRISRHGGYRSLKDSAKINPDEAGKDIVWTDNGGDMDIAKSILSVLTCGMRVVRCSRRPGAAVSLAEYAGAAGAAEYDTSAGRLSGSAAANTRRYAVLIEYDGDAAGLAELLGRRDAAYNGECGCKCPCHAFNCKCGYKCRHGTRAPLYIVASRERLAACAAFLHGANAMFGVWMPLHSGGMGCPLYVDHVRAGFWCLEHVLPGWFDNVETSCRGSDGDGRDACSVAAAMLHGWLEVDSRAWESKPRTRAGGSHASAAAPAAAAATAA